jgi:DNA recombination protein Rad52
MLNDAQYEQLLKPLNPNRVAKRSQAGRNLSYLEAWDVKAHLNRIFGFLNWSADVIDSSLAFEEKNEKGQWNVGYKVTLRLTIGDATYTECAVGSASLPQRGEAHDMAVKSAESDALKRAAINLGTQFGLSLYDNGSTKDVIGRTLDRDGQPATPVTDTPDALPDTEGTEAWINDMKTAIAEKDVERLISMKAAMNAADANDWVYQGVTLAKWLDKAITAAGKEGK